MKGGQANEYIFYKRSHFATQLPTAYVYSPTHYWLQKRASGGWRIGLTKFATRMLGEMVDHQFTVSAGARVAPGQILGWIEGFKAISDVYCVAEGKFLRLNPALRQDITLINRDPMGRGWLYEIAGKPDAKCLAAAAYRDHLDVIIGRLLEKQQAEEAGKGAG